MPASFTKDCSREDRIGTHSAPRDWLGHSRKLRETTRRHLNEQFPISGLRAPQTFDVPGVAVGYLTTAPLGKRTAQRGSGIESLAPGSPGQPEKDKGREPWAGPLPPERLRLFVASKQPESDQSVTAPAPHEKVPRYALLRLTPSKRVFKPSEWRLVCTENAGMA